MTAIDDRLVVALDKTRTGDEIASEIRQRLHWDALVDDGLIEVSVRDGIVTLQGTVGSAAEKRRARLKAHVAGVTSVDVDGLKVAKWARQACRRKRRPQHSRRAQPDRRRTAASHRVQPQHR